MYYRKCRIEIEWMCLIIIVRDSESPPRHRVMVIAGVDSVACCECGQTSEWVSVMLISVKTISVTVGLTGLGLCQMTFGRGEISQANWPLFCSILTAQRWRLQSLPIIPRMSFHFLHYRADHGNVSGVIFSSHYIQVIAICRYIHALICTQFVAVYMGQWLLTTKHFS